MEWNLLILLKDVSELQVNWMIQADKIAINASEKCVLEAKICLFFFFLPFIGYNLVNVI